MFPVQKSNSYLRITVLRFLILSTKVSPLNSIHTGRGHFVYPEEGSGSPNWVKKLSVLPLVTRFVNPVCLYLKTEVTNTLENVQ